MSNFLPRSFQELRSDRRGVTALEYGLLAGLIAVALITVLTTFEGDLASLFGRVDTGVNAAGT